MLIIVGWKVKKAIEREGFFRYATPTGNSHQVSTCNYQIISHKSICTCFFKAYWKPGGLLTIIATGFNPWFRAQCVIGSPEG
jgi:hypothetical protein